ncbi:ferritin-like protein [Archangium gephyra]|uniref:Ferritin-like protein n=1 Tax=Archangium gephyra TaxID=48 RepID=A0AAC8Q330_9BACT|nr:ferritin-like protein [Archangium gephyra]AKI99453.1 Hypothetical protein AA314_01080 [Archangium gephyra]REG28002.1 ferritin-like protein [Archangium gephyra]
MIRLQLKPIATLDDAYSMLQTAIGVEFGTLPPYLYALFSIPPGENPEAASRIRSVVLEEMIHMCLACNILNAIGGNPVLTPPRYPGPLPGDIGSGGKVLTVHLLPFSEAAMAQAMSIEQPEDPLVFPVQSLFLAEGAPTAVTIGQFYHHLDAFLATLPDSAWATQGRNQIDDSQFFAGQLFRITSYADAHKAIEQIVSEGEGSSISPLDFEDELAHYYRYEEIYRNRVLTKADNPEGFVWGGPLGVDWRAVYPAIANPGEHDFSADPPAARAAQAACDMAYSRMIDELQRAVTGEPGRLGNAVQAMFDLRMATLTAFRSPLADPTQVAGPSFRYQPTPSPGASL